MLNLLNSDSRTADNSIWVAVIYDTSALMTDNLRAMIRPINEMSEYPFMVCDHYIPDEVKAELANHVDAKNSKYETTRRTAERVRRGKLGQNRCDHLAGVSKAVDLTEISPAPATGSEGADSITDRKLIQFAWDLQETYDYVFLLTEDQGIVSDIDLQREEDSRVWGISDGYGDEIEILAEELPLIDLNHPESNVSPVFKTSCKVLNTYVNDIYRHRMRYERIVKNIESVKTVAVKTIKIGRVAIPMMVRLLILIWAMLLPETIAVGLICAVFSAMIMFLIHCVWLELWDETFGYRGYS